MKMFSPERRRGVELPPRFSSRTPRAPGAGPGPLSESAQSLRHVILAAPFLRSGVVRSKLNGAANRGYRGGVLNWHQMFPRCSRFTFLRNQPSRGGPEGTGGD